MKTKLNSAAELIKPVSPRPLHHLAGTLLWLMLSCQLAVAAETAWAPNDIVQAEQLGEVELSPVDPSVVLWVKAAPNKEKDELVSHIFRSTGSTGAVQLTRGKVSCTTPRFSPDGKRIAFLSARELPKTDKGSAGSGEDEPKAQIWLMEGGEPFALTEFGRGIQAFAWRDSSHIVFTAQEPPTSRELRFKEQKDKSVVVEDEENEPPVRLFEVDLASRKVTRRTTNLDRISGLFVAPDGQHAVTIHDQSLRFKYDDQVRPQSWLVDLRNGDRKRILGDRRFVLSGIVWSPDSTGFYALNRFTTHPKYLDASITELWHYTVADQKASMVGLDWPWGLSDSDSALVALSDGFLALLADGARQKAARYTRTGEGWRRDFLGGTSYISGWSAGRLGAASGLVIRQTSASQPPQLFLATVTGSDVKLGSQVSDLNPGWKDKAKARAEIVYWTGAKAERVEGLLYYPHQESQQERRPLVLMIHGGPFGASQDSWSQSWGAPIQLHCQRGAVVLCANYHGSSGYGLDFAQSISGGKQYYDLPVEDLEGGVDELVRRGLVDPERVGVLGWSNGAILTLALITRNPERYKAAGSGAGGFEWVADTSVTSFGQSFNDYYFGKMPWEDAELYRSVAPYYQADRIRTPLIIFHGDADTSVPIHHGWMQFRALQQRTRTPVRFVLFPGEEHGLKKLSSKRRKIEEELTWFDQYLYRTNSNPSPWLKQDAPITALVARAQAKHDKATLGELINGKLVPEVVKFQGVALGRFEVTEAQMAQFDPSRTVSPGRENFPASSISFAQAQGYCASLSTHTGRKWRLPTEEEASRIYTAAEGAENTLDHWAGYAPNAEDTARLLKSTLALGPAALLHEVGSFAGTGEDPVFDLGGNVAEWIALPNGDGRLAGGSADRPKDTFNEQPSAGLDYSGLRVIRE